MAVHNIIVEGYVQGVGFRFFVRETAEANGIRGEVWNANDGTVRVIGEHENESVLKRFEEELRRGPGRVDEVKVAEGEGSFSGFSIVRV